MGGNDHGVLEDITWDSLGGTEENHRNLNKYM